MTNPRTGPAEGQRRDLGRLVVLASDHVGYRVVKFLLEHQFDVATIVVDKSDRGGFNSDIEHEVATADAAVRLVSGEILDDPEFLADLDSKSPRLGILAWWPRLLKGPLRSVPALGWLNFHPSLLPHNRGKHPNFWCLRDGSPCGVSLHFIDDGIDSGPIVASAVVETDWTDTGKSVYLRSLDRIIDLFETNIGAILAGDLTPIPQDGRLASFHLAKELKPASTFDLDEPTTPRQLLNLIRARTFDSFPGAQFQDQGRSFEVRVTINEVIEHG
jgi:methionyl-tRNA formyltransferase